MLLAGGGGGAGMPDGHHDLGDGVSVVVHGVNGTDAVIDKTLKDDAFLHTAAAVRPTT